MTNCVGILQFDRQLHLSLLFPSPRGQELIGQFLKQKFATKPNSADFVRLAIWIGSTFLVALKAKSEDPCKCRILLEGCVKGHRGGEVVKVDLLKPRFSRHNLTSGLKQVPIIHSCSSSRSFITCSHSLILI